MQGFLHGSGDMMSAALIASQRAANKPPDDCTPHPSYECGFDQCWCHDSKLLTDFLDRRAKEEERNGQASE